MKHKSWVCWFAWSYGCPACKVKQLRREHKSPYFKIEVQEIRAGKLFTKPEKRWILEQVDSW